MKVEIVRQKNDYLGVPEQRQEVRSSESDIKGAIAFVQQLNRDNPELIHQVVITP